MFLSRLSPLYSINMRQDSSGFEFGVMYDHTLYFANHQSRHQATSKISFNLVIIYGHLSLPQGLCGYVRFYTYSHTHFIHPIYQNGPRIYRIVIHRNNSQWQETIYKVKINICVSLETRTK